MRILFVDDDDIRTQALREALVHLGGHKVDYVRAPSVALTSVEQHGACYDVIIIDIMLPHYDIPAYRDFSVPGVALSNEDGVITGLKLAMQVREILVQNKWQAKIVLLTWLGQIEQWTRVVGLQVDDIIMKPVAVPELVRRVAALGSGGQS